MAKVINIGGKNKVFSLSGHVYSPFLADHSHLDLTRIGHLGLDLLGDLEAQLIAVDVRNLVRLDDYTQFAAGLDSIGLFYARVGERQVFQVFDPL